MTKPPVSDAVPRTFRNGRRDESDGRTVKLRLDAAAKSFDASAGRSTAGDEAEGSTPESGGWVGGCSSSAEDSESEGELGGVEEERDGGEGRAVAAAG